MARPGASLGLFAYGFCMAVATVFMGVSLGTTHWLKTQTRWGNYFHYGLFRVCRGDYPRSCYNYDNDDPPDCIRVVRALCVCAILIFGLSLIRVAYMVLLQKLDVSSTRRLEVVVIFCFIASVLAMAGPGHYMNRVDDVKGEAERWEFGYSCYLAVASAPLSFLSGLFALFAARRLRSHCAQRPSTILAQPAPPMYTDGPPPTQQQSGSPASSAPPDYYSTHSQTTGVYPPPAYQHHQVQQGYNNALPTHDQGYSTQGFDPSYQGYDGNATTVPLPPPQVEKKPPPYNP